jgi:hypothetical protein
MSSKFQLVKSCQLLNTVGNKRWKALVASPEIGSAPQEQSRFTRFISLQLPITMLDLIPQHAADRI